MNAKRIFRTPLFWLFVAVAIAFAMFSVDGSGGYARIDTDQAQQLITDGHVDKAELTSENVLDLDPGEETRTLCNDYVAIASGMLSPPIPLPGTTYSRARKSRDRTLAFFRKLIAERRAAPRDDGLSRILQARDAEGVGCTDDEALHAFARLTRTEGIIPALESSHALAVVDRIDAEYIAVCLSGRGDKDLSEALAALPAEPA